MYNPTKVQLQRIRAIGLTVVDADKSKDFYTQALNELVTTATAGIVKREDLVTLQQLQAQFATELESLRGRVDTLDLSEKES